MIEELVGTQFVGSNELRKNLARLLDNLSRESEELVITKRGKPVAVLMNVEKYLEIQEALREFSDPAYLARLVEAKKGFAEGKGIPAQELYREKGL